MDDEKVCCVCGKHFYGWGNNPWPVADDGECCDERNDLVIISRLDMITANREANS